MVSSPLSTDSKKNLYTVPEMSEASAESKPYQAQCDMPPASASIDPEKAVTDDQPLTKPFAGIFKPLQMLMDTEITIEYGNKLQYKRVIHEELLCCHSKKQSELFRKSKDMLKQYERADQMRKRLKLYVSPQTTAATIEKDKHEDRLSNEIRLIYENYPFEKYATLKKAIDANIVEQINKRNTIDSKAFLKKDIASLSISTRLKGLNAKGLWNVVQFLACELKLQKRREHEGAKSNPLRAAAQKRILLPEADERVVRSLFGWLYAQGVLHYEDAEHLYNLQILAEKLGVTSLAEKSLSELVTKTEEMLQCALHNGLGLHHFLEVAPSMNYSSENMVQVAIHHVLKDEHAPERLRGLVVNILAEHLDPELWTHLSIITSRPVALSIIETMLRREQIKKELIETKTERDTS